MSTLKVGGIKHYDLAGDSDTIVLSGTDSAVTVKGTVTATAYYGDGQYLTNISTDAGTDSATVSALIDSDFSTRVLNDLSDVTAPTPTDTQVLVWDSANSYWKPTDQVTVTERRMFHYQPAAGTTALTGADKFGTPLSYSVDSDTLDVFVNGILLIADDYVKTNSSTLTLDIATDSNDEVVIFKYAPFVIADVVKNLGELEDVTITSLQDSDSLVYNSSTQVWENKFIPSVWLYDSTGTKLNG